MTGVANSSKPLRDSVVKVLTAEGAEARNESVRAPLSSEEPRNLRFQKQSSALLIVVAVVFVTARLWHLTSYGLFGDEVFTLWTAERDWTGLFSSVVGDVVHPPLFYALLKVWIGLGGQSLLWLKLLPASLSIASVVPFLFLCRALKLEAAAAILALWLMAVNGFLISHAQELRMYSLLLLLGVCSLWLFAKLLNTANGARGTQIALWAVNLLLVFTHYFGWVIVALQFALLIFLKRKRLRSFSIATACIALCFSPWVWFITQAARSNPSRVNFVWNRPPALSELAGYYGNLNGPLSYRWKVLGTALVMLLFLSPVIAWLARMIRARRDGREVSSARFWLLASFAFGPALLAFSASHLLPQPVWAFRYLIIAAPAYLLLAAAAALSLPWRRTSITLIVLMAAWSGVSGFAEMINRDRIAWEPLVSRLIQAERDPAQGIRIYVTDANVGNTIQFYLDQAGETRFEVIAVDSLNAPAEKHSWVAFIRYKHESQPPPQSLLSETGYIVGDAIESETPGHRAALFPVWKP